MPSELKFLNGTKITKGIEKELRHHIRLTAGLCREMIRESMKNGVTIDDRRVNYQPLEDSTKAIRKSRRVRRTSPMVETGNLMKAVKTKKTSGGYSVIISDRPHPRDGTPASDYGFAHMKDHTTDSDSMIPNKPVPARPFFGIPKNFYGSSRYKKLEKKLEAKVDRIVKNAVKTERR